MGQGGVQRRVARIRECERAEGKPAGGVQQADRGGWLRAEEVRVLGGRGAIDFRSGDVRARLGEESVGFSDADETSWERLHRARRADEPVFRHIELGFLRRGALGSLEQVFLLLFEN